MSIPPDPLDQATPLVPPLAGTLMERMGIEIIEASADRARGTMPVAGNTQPYGLLHGGANAVLAETLGSVAAHIHAQALDPAAVAVGIELNCTHHRAVSDGTVTGTATALTRGRSLAAYEIRIEDSSQRLVCSARLTCLVRVAPTSR